MSDRVTSTLADGVADIRLTRADKMNALDPAMFVALTEAGIALRDPGVRAAVLSGDGRGFCAGLDMASFGKMADDAPREKKKESGTKQTLLSASGESPANFAQRAAWVWREAPVPVIAALHGVVYGGGLQVALGADIRIVHPEARLSVMEIKWGLVPDMAGPQLLRHLVRDDVARELTYTGRIVSGEEAVELGLCTKLSDNPREDALEMARSIAVRSPDAIRADKQLLNESRLISVEEGLALEAKLQTGLIGSPNQVESVRANMEKRAPKYQDPS